MPLKWVCINANTSHTVSVLIWFDGWIQRSVAHVRKMCVGMFCVSHTKWTFSCEFYVISRNSCLFGVIKSYLSYLFETRLRVLLPFVEEIQRRVEEEVLYENIELSWFISWMIRYHTKDLLPSEALIEHNICNKYIDSIGFEYLTVWIRLESKYQSRWNGFKFFQHFFPSHSFENLDLKQS